MLTESCHEVVKRFQVADSQGIPRGLGVEKVFYMSCLGITDGY